MNTPAMKEVAVPAVEFRHVGKKFDVNGAALEVVHDFSLTVADGEFVSIVGVSGCGKSTLLRLLVGLDGDYEGEILVHGQKLAGIGGDRGIVFQDHRLFPWLTVEQNIGLGLVNEALPPAERAARIQEHVGLVGLAGFERALPHQLSGGMAQRAAIARGLVASPRILMLDEPFGALDALTRAHMQEELMRICERRRVTTLLVTHDVEEALYLSDRVVVMTKRPGTVRSIVNVRLLRPRDRTLPTLHELRRDVLNLLTGAETPAAESNFVI